MNWKRLASETEADRLIDQLNAWATDIDRFRRALIDPRSTRSASQQAALNTSFQVDATRVSGMAHGTTGTSGIAGGTGTQVQFNRTGNLAGDTKFTWVSTTSVLGVTGKIVATSITAAGLSVGSAKVTGNLSVDGTVGVTGQIIANDGIVINFSGLTTTSLWVTDGMTVTGFASLSGGAAVTNGLTADSLAVTTGATVSPSLTVTGVAHIRVSSLGTTQVIPAVDALVELGASGVRWSTVYGVTGDFSGRVNTGNLATTGWHTVSAGTSLTGLVVAGHSIAVVGGITVAGPSYFGSTVTVGTVNIDPVTTLTGALGRTIRRWGNIFGGTANFQSVTVPSGGTLSVLGNASAVDLSLSGNLVVQGTMTGPSSGVAQDWFTESGGASFSLGLAGGGEWYQLVLNGPALLRKGPDEPTGTTVFLQAVDGGNYYDLSGVTTIAGLSTEQIFAGDPSSGTMWTSGTPVIFQLDNNPSFTNSARLVLQAGVTFAGQTGDHIGFISTGSDSFREFYRWRANGVFRQAEGTNRAAGVATLGAGGSVTVATTLVTASSRIQVSGQSDIGTPGFLRVSARTAGATFVITSSSSTDAGTVAWLIVEPE